MNTSTEFLPLTRPVTVSSILSATHLSVFTSFDNAPAEMRNRFPLRYAEYNSPNSRPVIEFWRGVNDAIEGVKSKCYEIAFAGFPASCFPAETDDAPAAGASD